MHRVRNVISVLAMSAMLAACGGGSASTATSGISPPPASPPPTSSACSLRARQDFAFSVLNEWYLYPETLPASLDPTPYATVDEYIDALTATARSQRRDRFFTFRTSIAEENAFFNSGASAGFGVRLSYNLAAGRVLVAEAFENTPALAAGIDRGTEILAVGQSATSLQTVSSLLASGGAQAVSDALGPSTAGLTRVLRIADASGTRDVSVTKAAFDLTPVSSRYGARVISDAGRQVGYINMRTFIDTADPALRSAFLQFRTQGITNFVIDLRYNGGGLVSIAELMGNLLGGNRLASDVFSVTTFRPSKASNNDTARFVPQSQSVSPVRIAFITTGSSASASELVINSLIPYYGTNLAIVGANTFGKPVGQIAVDRAACDDRIRVIAFSTQNSAGQGFYYDGLASTVRASCQAADDLTHPFGDPQEASLRQALNFVGGLSCTPIASGGQSAQSVSSAPRLMAPAAPTAAQREVTGLF